MQQIKEQKADKVPEPILDLRMATLRAMKVMEMEQKIDGAKVYAPKVSVRWKVLDDNADGQHNGVEFWDNFSYVKSFEDETKYVIRRDTRIGDFSEFMADAFHNKARYFESDVVVDWMSLEGEDCVASVEPRRFKPEDPPTGSRTKAETLQLSSRAERFSQPQPPADGQDEADSLLKQRVQQRQQEKAPASDGDEWDDIPF